MVCKKNRTKFYTKKIESFAVKLRLNPKIFRKKLFSTNQYTIFVGLTLVKC